MALKDFTGGTWPLYVPMCQTQLCGGPFIIFIKVSHFSFVFNGTLEVCNANQYYYLQGENSEPLSTHCNQYTYIYNVGRYISMDG